MDFLTVYILGVVFVATLVRSAFGFGESLIAVPLLVFFIPMEIAVPLSVLISILIASVIVVQDCKQIHIYSAKWLILFAALGIPIGLLLLLYADQILVKGTLGALIVGYALFALSSKNRLQLKADNKLWLFGCGFLSGVLGGAYGLNGPPLVIYGNLRRWTAKKFRATLQAYFLPASMLALVGYWYNDLWTWRVTYYFLIAIPVIIPAIFMGRYINLRMKDGEFLNYIYVGLLGIGGILFTQSLLNF